MKRVWSPQQKAFLEFIMNSTSSCVLIAVAGAGKTTVILAACEDIAGSSAILAFSKAIAEELKAKLIAMGIDWKKALAGTVHSFGFSALRKAFPNVKVDNYKVANIIGDFVKLGIFTEATAAYAGTIGKIVSMAKQRAIGVLARLDDVNQYYDIIEHFDVLANDNDYPEHDVLENIVQAAIRVLKSSNSQTSIVDYDDMVYLPLIHRCRFWQYDNVFVDEAQDTNPARRALVAALVKKGGRVIAVGDPSQAIFGFTGADADSLDLIAKDFNAERLPLTVTYRCPKAVVAFAHQWVDHIQAHESAPEGSVTETTKEAFLERKDLDGEAAVLCRNTKPIVALAFELIRRKVACKVEGRDIGNGLVKLATKWSRIKTLSALHDKLTDYYEREKAKLLPKKQENKLQDIEDRVETLKVIIEECRSKNQDKVSDLVVAIEGIFDDKVKGILVLSTIHKSKGREWKRVFWLDRKNTCPSKWARQAWQVEQENNLCYVAATRSMSELIEIIVPALPKAK